MNREKADEFLQYIVQILKQNPDIKLNNSNSFGFIYNILVYLGVDRQERKLNTTKMFNEWIRYYRNKKNIQVFVSAAWKSFCQFRNERKANSTHIKVYLPTKYDYLENNAKIIFDYLSKNNIQHISKINKQIRFDNVVIRLFNKEDAINFLNFVKANPNLQEGLIKPNPFAFNHDNIAMACDGNNSYNYCVSCYIGLYIKSKQEKNELDSVSINDFIRFVLEYYKDKFVYRNNIDDVVDDFKYVDNETFYDDLLDIKNITELLIKAYEGIDINNYFEHFSLTNNPEIRRKEIKKLMGIQPQNEEELKNNKIMEAKDNLIILLNKLYELYDDVDEIYWILSNYFATNNPNYLTRRNNIRQFAIDTKIKEILSPYLLENNLTIVEYIKKINNKDSEEKYLDTADCEKIKNFFQVATPKYGKEETINRLISFLYYGNANLITRDDNMRDKFMQDNFLERTRSYLKKNSIDLGQYYSYFEKIYDGNEKEDSIG